ncbi:MAG: hypothetical protein HDS66_05435 [Bacteroidales bacterium]|nr:hypothetical protein [Bacteroidales bacterium]
MKKLSVWLLCSLLLAGCAHEELDLQQSVASPDYSVKISPEEAILRASLMIDKLDGTQTRLGGKRTVKDVKLLGNLTADRHTRSDNGADSLFYLINFEDEQGFALMSADRRTLPVYALVVLSDKF